MKYNTNCNADRNGARLPPWWGHQPAFISLSFIENHVSTQVAIWIYRNDFAVAKYDEQKSCSLVGSAGILHLIMNLAEPKIKMHKSLFLTKTCCLSHFPMPCFSWSVPQLVPLFGGCYVTVLFMRYGVIKVSQFNDICLYGWRWSSEGWFDEFFNWLCPSECLLYKISSKIWRRIQFRTERCGDLALQVFLCISVQMNKLIVSLSFSHSISLVRRSCCCVSILPQHPLLHSCLLRPL